MKKREWILTGIIVAAALIMLAVMKWMPRAEAKEPVPVSSAETTDPDASVPMPETKAKGDWIAVVNRSRVILYFDSGIDGEYEVEGNIGHMVIEVKDAMWHVKEVDCYDYTCQHMGWIGMDSILPIICLPNDIVIIDAATAAEMVTR